MTFNTSAYAINGTEIDSADLRRAVYFGAKDISGIVQAGDLKVTALSTPGVGIQIAPGVGAALNDYQTTPNETYIVSNPGVHTVPSGDMPASNASPKAYLVCVVIGDGDFSQTGHPFMGSDDPDPGDELTFEYVRIVLIECGSSDTTLGSVDYPHLVLARLNVPALTTTITNAYITDLRKLANPRQEFQIFASPGGTYTNAAIRYIPAGGSYADWGAADYSPSCKVPSWAKRAVVVANVNGVKISTPDVNISGAVRVQLGAVTGPVTIFDYSVGGGALRDNLMAAGSFDVSSIAGTTAALKIEGYENVPASPTNARKLALQAGSQVIFDVRFFEE